MAKKKEESQPLSIWKQRLAQIDEDDLTIGNEMISLVRDFKEKVSALPVLQTETNSKGQTVIVMPIPPAILTALSTTLKHGCELRRKACESAVERERSADTNIDQANALEHRALGMSDAEIDQMLDYVI